MVKVDRWKVDVTSSRSGFLLDQQSITFFVNQSRSNFPFVFTCTRRMFPLDSCSKPVWGLFTLKQLHYMLSRASDVGSPTNHKGSGLRQDTGPGILLYFTCTRTTVLNLYVFMILAALHTTGLHTQKACTHSGTSSIIP